MQGKDGPVFGTTGDVAPDDIRWLDDPFLPEGEFVTNNADGGTGKGLLSVLFATRVSLLGKNVLFAIAEEAVSTVLVPRLIAAGADRSHVKTVSWTRRGFADGLRIPEDIPRLEESLARSEVHLLVIDPLLSHLSSKTNSYVDHEVKRALQPLVDLAHRTGCTVLGNGHYGKDKTRGAVSAAQGSTAFTNTPRLAFGMAFDDEDPDLRVAEVMKSNIGLVGAGRNFRVSVVPVEGLSRPVPRMDDEGVATKKIDDLLLARRSNRVPSSVVRDAILACLANGSQDRESLNQYVLAQTGANADSVYKYGLVKLRDEGHVRCWKDGLNNGWWWELKNGSTNEDGYPSSATEPNNVFHLSQNERRTL